MTFDIYNLIVIGQILGVVIALVFPSYLLWWLNNRWPRVFKTEFYACLLVLFALVMCTTPIADMHRAEAKHNHPGAGITDDK